MSILFKNNYFGGHTLEYHGKDDAIKECININNKVMKLYDDNLLIIDKQNNEMRMMNSDMLKIEIILESHIFPKKALKKFLKSRKKY